MPVFTQLKALIAGAIVLVVLILAGLIYWRGSSNTSTKNDLRVAREVIKTERAAQQIAVKTDQRVNAEGIQTATTAQEATREIEAIRTATRLQLPGQERQQVGRAVGCPDVDPGVCDPAAARVLQLAREARAAAVASSAKLQSARARAR